ncbi:type IX secretion system outer membrane channel protein PorV [Compostibacter hankyongensis]|uniref:Type IX secretion system outer membrane channel protein PorV n=1 Tax=Compostibacter hankyongensis TaxID=1007089 RepID=A0ABP8FIJ3_9BACT
MLSAPRAALGQVSTGELDGRINTINTAVPFLRISPDARSGAMGDAGIALSPDASAVFWNLSKLPFAEKESSVSLTYTPWLKELVNDVFLATVSGYKKIDDEQAIGASLRYFDIGHIQFTDEYGQDQGDFHPREFAFDAGYARKLSDHWSVGLALRYIYSHLASGINTSTGISYKAGQAIAGDISAFYTQDVTNSNGTMDTWNAGITLTNLGSKISYTRKAGEGDFLPSDLGIGGAYTHRIDEQNKITFAADINKLLVPTPDTSGRDENGVPRYRRKSVVEGIFGSFSDAPGGFKEEFHELMYSLGVEYWYDDLFAVRAGYYNEHRTKGDRKYLTVGVGIKYEQLGFNFSYLIPSGGIQQNPLSNTLRFSLLVDFKQKE